MNFDRWRGHVQRLWNAPRHTLPEQARLQLLGMAFKRLAFSVHAMPFVGAPFLIWMGVLKLDLRTMWVWLLAYALGNAWVLALTQAFQRDGIQMPASQALEKWLPIIHRLALLHGLGVSLLSILTAGRVPSAFAYLLLTTQAAMIAGNATHQSPEIGTFNRFFLMSWGVCLLATPWVFGSEWPATLFLSLIYVVTIHRHTISSHQFFVKYMQLEEDSKQLAERYRMAKEEAESALQSKNQFLSTASHDLRQPVHAMGFLIESIAHRNQDPSLVPPLKDLRYSVRSITRMFSALLDLSRIEGGALNVQLQTVNIKPLLQEVTTLFGEEAKSRHLVLRAAIPKAPCLVAADPLLLKQSLVNLVHNALRYTTKGGVLLGPRRRGDQWRLEVWDTGMGVSDDDKSKVYSPFYRHEQAWHFDSAGHGLGLAVVARCAKLMGASYGLESREKRGSCFWIQLPAASRPAPLQTLSPAIGEALTPPTLQGYCLIVEDDPQVSSAWLSLMQAWGIEARCASSAQEAFGLLEQGFAPQAILCDQRLRSGDSGVEVLKALFARCPDASGAMISGEFSSPELQQAERDGFLVLRKPLDASQLLLLLKQWLGPSLH